MTTEEVQRPESETVAQLAVRLGCVTRTVFRWIHSGVSIEGRRVKLAARRVGGRWWVSREAWESFDRACNPAAGPVPESPAKIARRLAADRASALARIGR